MCIANLSTAFFQHVDAASGGLGCNYVVINMLISTMRNIDNNSIDAALNHFLSIVCSICYTEDQIACCETMLYPCLLSQMRWNM